MIREITQDQFPEVIDNADKLLLVDFYADWCNPCRMMSPVLEKLQEENKGQLEVVKVNVDKNSRLSDQLNIYSIPTILAYKDGKILKEIKGFMPLQLLKKEIERI